MKRMAMDVIDRKVEVIGNLSRNSALYRHVLALSYAMLGVQMNPKLVCPPGTRNEWCVCECVCVHVRAVSSQELCIRPTDKVEARH